MAKIHSERPRDNRTEARIYDLLADALDDDWQVWHEPEIQRTEDEEKPFRPDFILLHRQHGLFVLEVKGWTVDRIKDVRSARKKNSSKPVTEILYDFQIGKQWVEAPFDQLGKYKSEIRQQLKQCRTALGLTSKQVNLLFDGAVAFENISSSDVERPLQEIDADRLSIKRASVLSSSGYRAYYKCEIDTWEKLSGSVERDLSAANGGLSLSQKMMDIIRGLVHPEIQLPESPRPSQSTKRPDTLLEAFPDELRVLSLAQENVARYQIGSGHRILFGVAGSGKTMILIARARWQSMLNPARKILVLCFNRALSLYIAKVLEDYSNIDAMTFHAWVRERLDFDLDFGDEEYDRKLLDHLGKFDAEKYDSILIDECQDWRPDWFKASLFAANDPVNGDFLIVGDGSQSIYRSRGDFKWEDCGINPQLWRGNGGASIIFSRNYRNTRQIVALASSFARTGDSQEARGAGILSLLPDPDECVRGDGPKPRLGQFSVRAREMEFVATYIRRLINSIESLEPCDFAVVYPGHFGADKARTQFGALFEHLRKMSISHVHIQGGKERNQEMLLEGNSVKILNVKQMKGLEQRVCFVVGIDEYWDRDEDLLYVAMTRATDWLFLSWTGRERTSIIDRLTVNPALYSWFEDSRVMKKTVTAPQSKASRADINEILRCLNAERVRCTYGSVADLLRVGLMDVIGLLGQRRPEASWVVNKKSLMPTGYTKDQIHPDFDESKAVITTGIELQHLLDRSRGTQD